MGIRDAVREGFSEWLEDPANAETVSSLRELGGSEEFIEKFMTDDEFTQAIIDGSYPKGMFGIPTEEGIVKIATDIVDMAERNGGTFEPLLNALEENRDEVLNSFSNKDGEIKGADLHRIEQMAYDRDGPPTEDNKYASVDTQEVEDAVVLSSEDPGNSLLASLPPGAIDNLNLIDAQTGGEFNVSDTPDLSQDQTVQSPNINSPSMTV
jgi:hypothetical protein